MSDCLQPLFFFPDKTQLEPDYDEIKRYLGYKKSSEIPENVQTMIQKCAAELHKIITPKACYKEFDLTVTKENETAREAAGTQQSGSGQTTSKATDAADAATEKFEIFNIRFADLSFNSKNLGINLKNCTKVILFGATIGPLVDQTIRKAQNFGSAQAAVYQATGAMFAEKLTELLNQKIKTDYEKKGFKAHPRYSPGYGDISLQMQRDFFRLLPLEKIGLTLMDSLIMAPEKSVTAFIGLEKI